MSAGNRVAPGVSAGGQFAPTQHAEPAVALASDRPPDRGSLHNQLADARREAEEAKGRVSLLCARLLADEVATAYPGATHIRVYRNGYETMPAAIESILDENGAELALAHPAERRQLDDTARQRLVRWNIGYVEDLDLEGRTSSQLLTGEHPQPQAYGDYVDVLDVGKAQHIVADNSTRNGSS